MIVQSAAKLNLTLDILGLLPGGYHAIETVFQNIDLVDTLQFSFDQGNSNDDVATKISLTDLEKEKIDFPLSNDNLIAKSVRAFSHKTNLGKGLTVDVAVTKNIPIAAGLAGGSGNAAAALIALNEHFDKPLSVEQLSAIAASIGSDISFFLYGGTCAGRGRGEILEPISHNLKMSFLIVKPRDIAISTPWIYREYDRYIAAQSISSLESKLHDCENALRKGDQAQLLRSLNNVFEPIVYKEFPQVKSLRDGMLSLGCLSAHISGSGPTLYGLTASIEEAEKIKTEFRQWQCEHKELDSVKVDVWTARSTNFGTTIVSNT